MRVITNKGYVKLKISDKSLSAILSLMAVGAVKFDELKDKEVTVTKEDILEAGVEIMKQLGMKNVLW